MTRWLTLAALASAATVAATASSGSAQSAQVVITRDALTLPAGCTPHSVVELLARFAAAFNKGDAAELERLFAPAGEEPPAYRLFGVDSTVVYERERIVPFLLDLRSRGERFRVVALEIKLTGRASPTSVSVEYRLERPNGLNYAKGLVDCATGRLWQGAIGPRVPAALTLPCPRPAGWTLAGPVVVCTGGPNARALSPAFRVASGGRGLPGPCAAPRVGNTVRRTLTAFNAGGDAFAPRFVARGRLRAYAGAEVVGRRALTRFARTRYEAGDGWTALRLQPPRRASRGRAVYGLRLAVSYQGTIVNERAAAKVTADCRSGLVRSWVGPSGRTPGTT